MMRKGIKIINTMMKTDFDQNIEKWFIDRAAETKYSGEYPTVKDHTVNTFKFMFQEYSPWASLDDVPTMKNPLEYDMKMKEDDVNS